MSEGIECAFIPDFANHHVWNEAVLDGKTYKIDMANSADFSKRADGTYDIDDAQFIRDEWFMDRDEWLNKYYGPTMD